MRAALVGMPAVLDRADVVRRSDDALREQEPRRQLAVLPRRAHDDGERPAVEADVERFLGRGGVHAARDAGALDAGDLDRADGRQIVVARHAVAATVMISTRARAMASETVTGVMAAFAPNAARHAAEAARPDSPSVT